MTEATSLNDRAQAVSVTDEFYVGYLKMPAGYAFYVRLAMPIMLWFAIGAAVLVSSSQSNPGSGAWRTGQPITLDGLIDMLPYPLIRIPSSRIDRPFETVLLVQTGKFGAGQAAPFDGRLVSLTGWLIERDGRRMLELTPEDDAIRLVSGLPDTVRPRLQRPAFRSMGRVTLRGEIVDSKCYLGVMKPGEGKTHKECATLCISGGIPPMFVARDTSNTPRFYLLTNSVGMGLDREFLPFVADPVEITGEVEELGDILVFRVRAADIRRL